MLNKLEMMIDIEWELKRNNKWYYISLMLYSLNYYYYRYLLCVGMRNLWRMSGVVNRYLTIFFLFDSGLNRSASFKDWFHVCCFDMVDFCWVFFLRGGEADLHRRAISTVWLIHSNRLDWLNRLNRAIGPGLAIHQRLMSIKRRRGVRSFLDRFVAIWFPFRGLNRCCCCCCCCWQWWCCCCCCCCCLYAGTIPANLLIKIERTGTGRLAPFWIGWRAIRSFRHSFETGLLVKRCEFWGGGASPPVSNACSDGDGRHGYRSSSLLPAQVDSSRLIIRC